MIDEISALRAAAGPERRPGPDVESRARAALVDHIQAAGRTLQGGTDAPARSLRSRGPRGRWSVRLGLTTAAVAAVVVAGVAVENIGGVDDDVHPAPMVVGLPFARPANAAETLANAAASATRRMSVTARPEQWVYQERRQIDVPDNARPAVAPFTYTTYRSWRRLDGKQTAELVGGRLVVHDQTLPPGAVADDLWDYAKMSALTTPEAVLAWATPRTPVDARRADGAAGRAKWIFSRLNALLRSYVLPPAVEAAVYGAISRIEGVRATPGQVDLDGRPAVALGLAYQGVSDEILLDPESYRYVGERAVVVEDHTVATENGERHFRVGDVLNQEAMVFAAIVDRPGDTG
jgi:hypothetical protein